jgi:Holliday junction resolvase-like predicted endonuclease
VVARNLRTATDEVDLVVRFAHTAVAVEVKTRLGADPIDEFDAAQAAHLRRAAGELGAGRCDLVTVRICSAGAGIRWLPGVC